MTDKNITNLTKPELKVPTLNLHANPGKPVKEKTEPVITIIEPPKPLTLPEEAIQASQTTETSVTEKTQEVHESAGLEKLLQEAKRTKDEIDQLISSRKMLTAKLKTELKTLLKKSDDLNHAIMNEMMNMVEQQENN